MADALAVGLLGSGLTLPELWLRYFGLGGNASEAQVGHYVSGRDHPSDRDHDLLAHALNERYQELDLDTHVRYADEGGNPSD